MAGEIMCVKIIKFSVSSCCLVCCLRNNKNRMDVKTKLPSLALQTVSWLKASSGQGRVLRAICCCFDWICLWQERSQVRDSSFQPTPSALSHKSIFHLAERRRSVIWLPTTKKKLLHTFFTGRTGLPRNSPDSCLRRWLLCAKYYLSWIPGLPFFFCLPCRVSQLLEAPRCKCTISTNLQSPENASSPNY